MPPIQLRLTTRGNLLDPHNPYEVNGPPRRTRNRAEQLQADIASLEKAIEDVQRIRVGAVAALEGIDTQLRNLHATHVHLRVELGKEVPHA